MIEKWQLIISFVVVIGLILVFKIDFPKKGPRDIASEKLDLYDADDEEYNKNN